MNLLAKPDSAPSFVLEKPASRSFPDVSLSPEELIEAGRSVSLESWLTKNIATDPALLKIHKMLRLKDRRRLFVLGTSNFGVLDHERRAIEGLNIYEMIKGKSSIFSTDALK